MAETYDTTPADVARVIPARTRAGGGVLGEFTDLTSPTADQVEEYIADAAADIEADVGAELGDEVHELARRVIALDAAKRIELGADDFDEARYDRLERLYTAQVARLTEAAQEVKDGGDPGDVDDLAAPLHSFPPPATDVDLVGEGDEVSLQDLWNYGRR